jgi:hypothetical protein
VGCCCAESPVVVGVNGGDMWDCDCERIERARDDDDWRL